MAGTIINNLYPPQIEAVAPAFSSVDSYIKIYYAFSIFNSETDANFVHITLVMQETNENVLNTSTGTGILIQKITEQHDSNGYYIILKPNNIIDGWINHKIYKLQIRFDNSDNEEIPSNTTNYFNNNQEHFSEWSTICLLQPIAKPYLRMSGLSDDSSNRQMVINNTLIISGSFEEEGTSSSSIEQLNYFVINILDDSGVNCFTSEKIFTGENLNPNTLNYTLNLNDLNLTKQNYTIRIVYTTKHLYTNFKDFYISLVGSQEYSNFSPFISVNVNEEDGLFNLKIINSLIDSNNCNLYIKRSSSWSNFTNWEDFKIIKNIKNGKFNYTIKDNTIESMVWYQYSIQAEYIEGNNNNIFTPIYYSDFYINNFYDMIISDKDRQINLKFNTKIANLRKNVSRNKIDTLGSKYPKFIINKVPEYYSFALSSLISSQSDDNKLFLTKEEVFSEDVKTLYDNYNSTNRITAYNDYLWERVFRQKLFDWLNNGEPKLLRSETEGNMVVFFTEISLTPFTGTSRRLYEFSATVYEVADANNLKSLNKMNIFSIENI